MVQMKYEIFLRFLMTYFVGLRIFLRVHIRITNDKNQGKDELMK